jgi:hypothetical protein
VVHPASSLLLAGCSVEETMKKTLLITGVLLALTASLASAGGINLAWNDCVGGGGLPLKVFACTSNTGNNDLYMSFDPPVSIPDVNGSNPIVDLQSASSPLPQWWQFKNSGTCRLGSLSALAALPGTCVDTWAGAGTAGVAAYLTNSIVPSVPPNRARILGSISVPTLQAASVAPGTEYFLLMFRINNAKSTGSGACAGCSDPVCLVLNEVLLTSNNSGDTRITNPLVSNFASWQAALANCPGATPTNNKTWGQLKSIYR